MSSAIGAAKVIFSKGKSELLRSGRTLSIKNWMKVLNGDTVITSKNGLVVIKSKACIYKVSKNSNLILDSIVKEIINSSLIHGSIVVEFMKKKLKNSEGKTLRIKKNLLHLELGELSSFPM
jgi:hypothetical protein